MKESYLLVSECVLKEQGFWRDLPKNVSAIGYHLSSYFPDLIAEYLQEPVWTFSIYITNTKCLAPTFSGRPTLSNSPVLARHPSKAALS